MAKEDAKLDELLISNGFQPYVALFRAHEIRSDVLGELTSEDLVEVGVTSLGHRVRLLKLIEATQPTTNSSPATNSPATNSPATAQPSSTASTAVNQAQASLGGTSHGTIPTGLGNGGSILSALPAGASITGMSTAAGREVLYLRQRVDSIDKQVRRLQELVTRLRADIFRQRKEGEPLPTPGRNATSPSVTPGSATPGPPTPGPTSSSGNGNSSTNTTTNGAGGTGGYPRRSPSEGYFSRTGVFPGSAVPSPSGPYGGTSSSHPHSHATSSHATSSHGASHAAPPFTSLHTPSHTVPYAVPSSQQAAQSSSNLFITTPSELTKFYRCSEHDNAARVLSAIRGKNSLDGDASQWRLQIVYGDMARDLLDHEYPLPIFKQLQEQGFRPTFHPKRIHPHKPLNGAFI